MLPTFYRNSNWRLLYRLERDGTSMITFFSAVKDNQNTILVIRDECGYIFGAFCTEMWSNKYGFFGNGENFLYTFKDEE
jgi:hypothetical protein